MLQLNYRQLGAKQIYIISLFTAPLTVFRRNMMKFKYGYSFYPEHCADYDEIEKDFKLIKDSGANIVRMAEFAWDLLEPEEGHFEFDLLERVINDLGKMGVMTVLSTPTACPPAWLATGYNVAYVNALGYKKPFGSRRHYCPNKPDMQFYSKRIVTELAKKFGNNPYVYGWQIDNELAHNGTGRCRCEYCAEEFRNYLKRKFDNDISKLNKAYGTYFWSGQYNSFEQINPPAQNTERGHIMATYPAFYENTSLRLEFERFSSNSMVNFMNMQTEIIKKYSDKPVSTNSTGLATNTINYFELYKNADRYGIDNYPSMYHGNNDYCAVNFAHGRGCKENKPFWVLEFTVGGGHTTSGGGRVQPYPGAIEQNVVYAYASGAELLTHFQFKAFRSGAEQLNYAVLDADRIPRRRYFEFRKTSETLEKLENIIGNGVHKKNRSAIVMSYSDLWAVTIKPLSAELNYMECLKDIFSVMNELNIAPEIISPEASFDDYDLIISPLAITMTEDLKIKLKEFTRNGGTVLTTFGCAIKDENNLGIPLTYPCNLNDLFGVEVQEFEPIHTGVNEQNIELDGKNASALYWIESLKCTAAEPLAVVSTGYRKGQCVLSRNSFGNGTAYYLGTYLPRENMKQLISQIAEEAKITAPFTPTPGTDIQVMIGENGKEYIFVFNYQLIKTTVTINGTYKDVLNDRILEKEVTLEPKGYICITRC